MPINTAKNAINVNEEVICANPIEVIKITNKNWLKIIQDFLCPNILVRIGNGLESIKGETKNFKE